MSLNWNITDIENHKTVCWRHVTNKKEAKDIRKHGTRGFFAPPWTEDDGEIHVLSAVTNSLIVSMMGLGCKGVITAKNVDLVISQVAIYQRVSGPLLASGVDGRGIYITPDQVRAHIGLTTNCYGETPRVFKEKIWKDLNRDPESWIEHAQERIDKEREGSLKKLANAAPEAAK